MQKLVDGIHEFQKNDFVQNQELFAKLAEGQTPIVLLITCSDSRIDPNLLTKTNPGELFVIRTAGNIIPPYGAVAGGEAATVEYAISGLNIKDIIICGHSHCGAMSGLLNPEAVSQMPAVSAYLQHAEATRRIVQENHGQVTDQAKRLTLTVEENVLVQLENLRTHPSVAAAIGRGELRLHGWVYKFESGEVFAFNPDKGKFLPLEDVTPSGSNPDRIVL